MNKHYYPDIRIEERVDESNSFGKYSYALHTILRKKHRNGKWYEILVSEFYRSDELIDWQEKYQVLSRINASVYKVLILGTVYPKLKNKEGNFLYPKSINQESEEYRLITKYANYSSRHLEYSIHNNEVVYKKTTPDCYDGEKQHFIHNDEVGKTK